jgi:acetyl-CoA acetyltransferase
MGGVLAPLTAAALAMQVVQVLASAAYDVGRRKARFVLVTTCIAGGQGLAAIFEAVR